MKVVIIGLPYFSKILAYNLSNYDKDNTYISLNTYQERIDQLKYLANLHNIDVVYSIGGTIRGSKTIDLALSARKRIFMHWVGTDVSDAVDNYNKGKFKPQYLDKITHFSEVSWIQDELRFIGINTDIVQFATFGNKIFSSTALPNEFSVLSYIGKGREQFYGINMLIKLATDFPEVKIRVTGIADYREPVPSNLILLGWVDRMEDLYQNCVLYLRLPEHDGLGFSVLEALGNARYVGYSHKYNHTSHIDSYSKLCEVTKDLQQQMQAGVLQENIQGAQFVRTKFSEGIVLGSLICKFKG